MDTSLHGIVVNKYIHDNFEAATGLIIQKKMNLTNNIYVK